MPDIMEWLVQDSFDSQNDPDYQHDTAEPYTHRANSLTPTVEADLQEDMDYFRDSGRPDNILPPRRQAVRPFREGMVGPDWSEYTTRSPPVRDPDASLTVSDLLPHRGPETFFMRRHRDYASEIKTFLEAQSRGPHALTREIVKFEREHRCLSASTLDKLSRAICPIFLNMHQPILRSIINGDVVSRAMAGELRLDQGDIMKAIPRYPIIYVTAIARASDGSGPSVMEMRRITQYLRTECLDPMNGPTTGQDYFDVVHKHITQPADDGFDLPNQDYVYLLETFTKGLEHRLAHAEHIGATSLAPCLNVGWTTRPEARQKEHQSGTTNKLQKLFLALCEHLWPGAWRLFFLPVYRVLHSSEASFGELAITRVANAVVGNGMLVHHVPGRNNPVNAEHIAASRREIYESGHIQRAVYEITAAVEQQRDALELAMQHAQHEAAQNQLLIVRQQEQLAQQQHKMKELETELQQRVCQQGRHMRREASISTDFNEM